MVVSPDPFLDECFIKKPIRKQNSSNNSEDNPTELKSFIQDSAKNLVNTLNNSSSLEKPNSLLMPSINLEEPPTLTNTNEESKSGNLDLNIEEVDPEPEPEEVEIDFQEKEDPNVLKEFDLSPTLENNLESITLKKPNQVYYEIYQKAREKAKEAKKMQLLHIWK